MNANSGQMSESKSDAKDSNHLSMNIEAVLAEEKSSVLKIVACEQAIAEAQQSIKNCNIDLKYLRSLKTLFNGGIAAVMKETQIFLEEYKVSCVRIWSNEQNINSMWVYNVADKKLTLYEPNGIQMLPFKWHNEWLGYNMQLFHG